MTPTGTVILLWISAFAACAALAVLALQRVGGRRDPAFWTKFGVQLLLVAAFIVPAWLGGGCFDAVCVALVLLGARELLGLWRGARAPVPGASAVLLLALGLVLGGAWSLHAVVALSPTAFGFFYAAVELNDSFAHIVGKHVGRTPLAPSVSPNKTWEGVAAGIVAAGASGALLGRYLDQEASRLATAAIGSMLGACAVLADLAASTLKRRFGVKDFSNLLPGHGGVLDACDSVLLVAPVYLLLLWSRS